MFGEVAAYAFFILVGTGVFLTIFFEPSAVGGRVPRRLRAAPGLETSEAYASTLRISFDVPIGLLMRQIHHWAALLFLLTIVLHLGRIFFTGAFRRPRELNWIIGVTLLLAAIANGFLGYSLLDDLLSGTGLRIAYSIAESIPVVGTWVANLFFGGTFPGDQMIRRMFVLHVLIVPAVIFGLLSMHLALVWRQKHTQFPGRGSGGQRRRVTAVAQLRRPLDRRCCSASSPCSPRSAAWCRSTRSGCGALRAVRGDHRRPARLVRGVARGSAAAVPGMGLHPVRPHRAGTVLARRVPPGVHLPRPLPVSVHREAPHRRPARTNCSNVPGNRPGRVAFGAGAFAFYLVLFVAGSQDIFASWMNLTVESMVFVERTCLFVLPPIVGAVAWKWAKDLQKIEGSTAEAAFEEERGTAGSTRTRKARR